MMTDGDWHNQVRADITLFLKGKGYSVDDSHGGKDISLFINEKSNATHISDVDILATKENKTKYLIEIQENITPKAVVGIVTATNIATCHVDPEDKTVDIRDSTLFVVVPDELVNKPGSKKNEQLAVLQRHIPPGSGSLRSWLVCSEKEFKETFERREKVDARISSI